MTAISDFLARINAYLPEVIFALIVLALIVLIGIIFLTTYFVKKAIRKKVPPPPPPVLKPEAKPEVKPEEKPDVKPASIATRAPEYRMPPRFGSLAQLLSLKGYFRVGDVSLIFLKGLEFLKQRLNTINYKYHLPWYLLVGTTHSGKTCLLERSDISLPLGKPTFDIPDPTPGLQWWFLNRGVILEVRGDFLIKERGIQSDEKGWRTVINLLTRYRARRPIDGMILAIPATEFYGAHKLSFEELADRGKLLAQKLLATQNMISLRIPVYVVITKSDIIPGFQSLCQALPPRNHQDILGWSSPYNITVAYTPQWLDEAFGHIHNQLSHVRLEMLAEGLAPEIRDGVFIFPNELLHIQNNLAYYMDQIFKVNSYDDGLTLRGIYFCGDSGINLELSQLTATPDQEDLTEDYVPIEGSSEVETSPIVKLKIGELEKERHGDENLPTKIFFIDDLLRQKVFFETGLAQPIRQRLISANRNLMLAKASIAGFMGISTIGLFHAYDRIAGERDYLMPVLDRIHHILRELPQTQVEQSPFTTNKLDDQTRQLLEMMMNVHKADFFSFFFPSSWFSPINDNLRAVLKASYNQIIIRAVHVDLLLKARDLLTLRPKPTDLTVSLASQLQPTTTIEYQLFKNYTEGFIGLYDLIEKFNRLKESSDPVLVRELVQHSLGLTLPEEFDQNYEYFRRVFQEHPYPKIDLKLYQGAAQETLKILYNHFLTNLFSSQTPNSIIGKINFVLREFSNQQQETTPNLEILRKIASDLSDVMPILGVPGNNWIDAPYFDPGDGFADVMAQISQFSLFGPVIVNGFATNTADVFHNFQHELIKLNATLVDPLQISSDKPVYPSQGLVELQRNLAILFSEPFMASPPEGEIHFHVPENQVVFWNSKLIDQAVGFIQKYEEFMAKYLKNFPPLIQENIKQAARRNLQNNILGLLARAQVLTDIDEDQPASQAAEQVLQNKIANVREIVPKFIKLLDVMDKGQVGGQYVRIREMLGILSTRLLEKVEELLNSYKLYQVKDDNFNWWDGKKSPVLQGFYVRDEVDLKSYLKVQRDLVMRFALEFAEPMVTFLTSKVMEGYEGNTPMVNKWKQIIDQAHAYQKRRPDNSITALENTLIKDLLPINLNKCFKTIPLKSVKAASGNYFLEREIEIKRDLLSRCEVLKRQESIENYTKMATFFNEHLKGKFPFLTVPHSGMPDAEAEDIREFFYLYKEAGDNPKAILDQVYQLGEMSNSAMAFLKEMEDVKQLFEPYLKSESVNATPSLNFAIEFRVNTQHEVNANLILNWFIKLGQATTITRHDKVKKGIWYYGHDVTVGFRWPEQSSLHPFRDPAQPNLEIEDQLTALFHFSSKWSLLELLKTQQASRVDFGGQADPNPYTLKFFVYNSPTEQTVIFNRITLLSPDKGKTPGKPMVLPDFPTVAPDLPDDITSKADQPVIVMGAAYPHEEDDEEDEGKGNPSQTQTEPQPAGEERPDASDNPEPEEEGYEDSDASS